MRRVGNSNVISIPKALESAGYAAGTEVLLEQLDDGSLRLVRVSDVQQLIRSVGRRVVAEDREALEMLAAYDRGAAPAAV